MRPVEPEGAQAIRLVSSHSDKPDLEINLVRGGRRAYLWIGNSDECLAHFSGPQALRALARAILAEVPDTRVGRGAG